MYYFPPSSDESFISPESAASLDAIFVLGGGVPNSLSSPPEFVKKRCDAAVAVAKLAMEAKQDDQASPCILCLSAGTAHLPQLMSGDGLPIWEATSSAAYIIEKYGGVIPKGKVFVETTSYDTISNAYFARTSHSEISGWRNILVVTSEFHMDRSMAIFDWIFHANHLNAADSRKYSLSYLSCENTGLSEEAVEARKQHEKRSAENIRHRLSKEYKSLLDVWHFLTQHHDFYSAEKLVIRTKRATEPGASSGKLLQQSYGASAGIKNS